MFIVIFVFLVDCFVIIFVVVNFVVFVLEFFGLMYIWDVILNGVLMIIFVMVIGFVVDYSVYIVYVFVMLKEESVNKWVVDVVSIFGVSVLMGGKLIIYSIIKDLII